MQQLVMEQIRMLFDVPVTLSLSDERMSPLHDYFASAIFQHVGEPLHVVTEAHHVTGSVFHIKASASNGIEWAALGVCATPHSVSHQPYLEILHRDTATQRHCFIRCNRTIAAQDGSTLWALAYLHRGPNINHWPNHLLRTYHTPEHTKGHWQYFFCTPGHHPAVLFDSDVQWLFDAHEEHRV